MASLWVMDHFFQISMVGPPEHEMLEGYSALASPRASRTRITSGHHGDRRDLPPPGCAGQDRHHAGRALRRSGEPRHRRRVERGGAPRAGRAVPAAGGALRAARGDAADRPPDVVRRRQPVCREALPPRAAAQLPAARCPGRTRRSWSVAPARRRRCGSWRKYADACNIFEMGVDGIRAEARRAPEPLRQTRAAPTPRSRRRRWDGCRCPAAAATGTLSVDQAVQRFGELAEIGVDQAIVSMPGVHDPASFELVPALVEQLAGITPSGR